MLHTQQIDPHLQRTHLEERSLYMFAYGYPGTDGLAQSCWILSYACTSTTMLSCSLYPSEDLKGAWEKRLSLDSSPSWHQMCNKDVYGWLMYRVVGPDNHYMSEDILRHASQVINPRLDSSLSDDWIPKMFLFDVVMWLREHSMITVDDPGRWWKELQDCVQHALDRKYRHVHDPYLVLGTLSR